MNIRIQSLVNLILATASFIMNFVETITFIIKVLLIDVCLLYEYRCIHATTPLWKCEG